PTSTPIPPIIVTSQSGPGGPVSGPFGEATVLAGTRIPTAAYVVNNGSGWVYRAGGPVVATVQPGVVAYVVNPATGRMAAIDEGGNMSINAAPFLLSPMSQYGLGNFRVTGLRWSADGRYLAFRVERPGARDGHFSFEDTISDGVWIWDRIGNTTRHIFRNE